MKPCFALLFLLIAIPALAFQSIVILPFANQSQEQHLYWLGEGFAESLSEELMFRDAYVIQRQQKRAAYDELKLPYTGELSRATMRKVGEEMAADYVVFGSFKAANSELYAEARVVKLSTSVLSATIQGKGKLEQLYDVQTVLRNGLVQFFAQENLQLLEEKPFQNGVVPLYAYEQYIKGLLETSDTEKIKLFQRAMELKPGYQQATYRLGIALSRLQRYTDSSNVLGSVTFQGIISGKARFLIALNSYYSQDFDAAYQQWYELSKEFPTAEVYNNAAVSVMRKNDFQNSGWYAAKAVDLGPTVSDYHFNLAASYVQRKYDRQAFQKYRDTAALNPGDYQAFYLASKLLERESEEQLRRHSKLFLQLFQETLPADQKGKFPEQYSNVVQLLRIQPALLSGSESEYIRRASQKAAKERAEYVKTYQSSARKYLEDGDPGRALTETRKAVALDPFNWYLHYLWGWALVDQENYSAAVPELEFSIWCKDNLESRLILAELYRQSERFADAKMQVQRSLALDPDNKKALDLWGKIADEE